MSNKWSKAILGLVQVADIAVHVATEQVEPLRIAASLIILGWLAARSRGQAQTRASQLTVIGAYLALNLAFLAQAGLTNPDQGGQLRVLLLVFVLVTLGLAEWLQRQQK
ncbi:MAG: hypothetical protein KIT46_08610 [Anaerolineales bacterium]|nr:hypothetical protein [Anaerolineales bacterium]MCW5856091.1 hypothetical protein [Anaerolineales bacterium]